MASVGFGTSSSNQGSRSTSQSPLWATRGAGTLAGRMMNQTSISDPSGNIGKIWQNLFGQNPSDDYLGARQRLEGILSGSAMGDALGQATKFMEPQVQRLLELGNMGLTNAAGRTGTRFGSDLMNQQRAMSENVQANALSQISEMARAMTGQQLDASQGIFNQIGQLGEQNLARQLPLLISLLTGFPKQDTGSSWGSSSAWNIGAGVGK